MNEPKKLKMGLLNIGNYWEIFMTTTGAAGTSFEVRTANVNLGKFFEEFKFGGRSGHFFWDSLPEKGFDASDWTHINTHLREIENQNGFYPSNAELQTLLIKMLSAFDQKLFKDPRNIEFYNRLYDIAITYNTYSPTPLPFPERMLPIKILNDKIDTFIFETDLLQVLQKQGIPFDEVVAASKHLDKITANPHTPYNAAFHELLIKALSLPENALPKENKSQLLSFVESYNQYSPNPSKLASSIEEARKSKPIAPSEATTARSETSSSSASKSARAIPEPKRNKSLKKSFKSAAERVIKNMQTTATTAGTEIGSTATLFATKVSTGAKGAAIAAGKKISAVTFELTAKHYKYDAPNTYMPDEIEKALAAIERNKREFSELKNSNPLIEKLISILDKSKYDPSPSDNDFIDLAIKNLKNFESELKQNPKNKQKYMHGKVIEGVIKEIDNAIGREEPKPKKSIAKSVGDKVKASRDSVFSGLKTAHKALTTKLGRQVLSSPPVDVQLATFSTQQTVAPDTTIRRAAPLMSSGGRAPSIVTFPEELNPLFTTMKEAQDIVKRNMPITLTKDQQKIIDRFQKTFDPNTYAELAQQKDPQAKILSSMTTRLASIFVDMGKDPALKELKGKLQAEIKEKLYPDQPKTHESTRLSKM